MICEHGKEREVIIQMRPRQERIGRMWLFIIFRGRCAVMFLLGFVGFALREFFPGTALGWLENFGNFRSRNMRNFVLCLNARGKN